MDMLFGTYNASQLVHGKGAFYHQGSLAMGGPPRSATTAMRPRTRHPARLVHTRVQRDVLPDPRRRRRDDHADVLGRLYHGRAVAVRVRARRLLRRHRHVEHDLLRDRRVSGRQPVSAAVERVVGVAVYPGPQRAHPSDIFAKGRLQCLGDDQRRALLLSGTPRENVLVESVDPAFNGTVSIEIQSGGPDLPREHHRHHGQLHGQRDVPVAVGVSVTLGFDVATFSLCRAPNAESQRERESFAQRREIAHLQLH